MIVNTTKAGLLFKPVAGVLAAGFLSTYAFNATAQTFTNTTVIRWDSALFNTQGEAWTPVDAEDLDAGCTHGAHPVTAEFLYTGAVFDIAFIGSDSYSCQVYVEVGGLMYKAATTPITSTTPGAMNTRVVLASSFHGRVRIVLTGAAFVGIRTETAAIVKPAPDRILAVCDGGDWSELTRELFEATGITWAPLGQPDTGYFTNSEATVTDDTAAADGRTRLFSAARKTAAATVLAARPLFYLITGSRADAGISGATGYETGPMAVRAKACYDWIRTQAPDCTIVQLSPSPYIGAGAAGAADGPPTVGNPHDLNRMEQNFALTKTARAKCINAFGPDDPWWRTTTQQAQLAADGQLTALGAQFYTVRIAAALAHMLVPNR